MTLKIKILGILLFLMTITAIMDFAVHRWMIYPNFTAMEQTQAKKDLSRCVAALQAEIDYLDAFADDWAAWNDTYRFIAERTRAYIDSNLGPQTFMDNRLNLIAFYNTTGNRIWGRTYNLETGRTVPIQPFTAPFLRPAHTLLHRTGDDIPIRGIFSTDQGPMLIASRPILTSDRQGPVKGTLIMGRLLSRELTGQLATRTQVDHHMWSLGDERLAPEEQKAAENINSQSPFYLSEKKYSLQVYTTVPDIAGIPALLIRADISRGISARGLASIRYAVVSDALVSGAVLILLFSLLQRMVIRPICVLTRHAESIRAGDDIPVGCVGDRRDEIGVLCRTFEGMMNRLRSTHQGLVREIDERRRSRKMLDTYHVKLRRLSSELLIAQESERRRIAVDLHDRIGQALTVSKMRLDALCANRPCGRADTTLREISAMLERTIADTRMLTFELSPPILYELGLTAALEWLAEKFSREHDLRISFNAQTEDLIIDTHLRVMLFQATRELLFNIVKHARAGAVEMRMTTDGRALRIIVSDDGRGFESVPANSGRDGRTGFGIFNIKERLSDLGGRLDIDSGLDKGTRVTLVCPLSSPRKQTIGLL
jgi:signal transduction histidine kinase